MLLLEDIGLTPAELSYSLHKIQSSQTITVSCEVIQHAIHPSRLQPSTTKRWLAEPIDYKHNSKRRRNTIPTPTCKKASLQLRRQSSKPPLALPQNKEHSNLSNPSNTNNHPSPSDPASPTEVVLYKDGKPKQPNLTKPKEPKLRYGFSFQQLEEMQAIFRDQPRISDSFKNDLATKFKTFPECIDSWFSFNRQQVRWQRWQEQEKMRLAKAEEKKIRDLVILQKKLEDLRVLIREAAE